ncbi:hypothetical protein HPB49_005450 [Dermacentor silvarum]|uniref:Uncharacterized protein n=1 Tax=Dermacentor silvarum TaxID=543639 RepID=A0ACB8DVH3_DERSI|nr:hypothetical protein HPB49_005450 [Dermacentor silvarum]
MSVRGQIWAVLDVILRVPPLFVMDAVLSCSLGLRHGSAVEPGVDVIKDNSDGSNSSSALLENDVFTHFDLSTLLWSFLYLQAFLGALVMAVLQTRQLLHVYLWLSAQGAVLWSYVCNPGRGPRATAALALALLAPTVTSVCLVPAPGASPVAAALGAQLLLAAPALRRAGPALAAGRRAVARTRALLGQLGGQALLEAHWASLRAPTVLRLFWLLRLAAHAALLPARLPAAQALAELAARGCDTSVALLGMASLVAALARLAAGAARRLLLLEGSPERSLATVAGLLFLVLALQTGLTSLDPPQRLARLARNICLLATAVLHFVQGMLGPLLVSLGASRSGSRQRHARALGLSLALAACPCLLLTYLWTHQPVSTWLLAVSAFSAELVVKVVISLLIYLLFLVDARRETMWEPLDDYVYYLRATGSVLEFLFGVFLLFNELLSTSCTLFQRLQASSCVN